MNPTSARFPRCARLRSAAEIERVARTGARQRGRWFSVRSLPAAVGIPRLAVRIPKRVERLANRRNAARRIVREVFRQERQRLAGCDLLMAQTRSFTREDRAAVRVEVQRLLLGVECARS